MVKSQKSSTKLFHQWPANSYPHEQSRAPPTPSKNGHRHDTTQPHTPGHHQHHESGIGGFGTLTSRVGIAGMSLNMSMGMGMGMGIGIRLDSARTPVQAAETKVANNAISGGGIIVPGSPSQTDPFGSQVTSPTLSRSPIPPTPKSHSHSHSHARSQSNSNGAQGGGSVRSRPPSTVLSSSSNSPSVGVVTPKIILASPSTSTIHYLFPSSDTKTALHLSPSSPATATSQTDTASGTSVQEGVKRTQSVSKRERQRTSVVGGPFEGGHRDIPGLKNKRSLPNPAQSAKSTAESNALAPSKKVVSASSPSGLKKSDIGKPIPSPADESRDYSKGYYDLTSAQAEESDMGTLRRQPAIADLSSKGKIALKSRVEVTGIGAGVEGGEGLKRKESIILKEIENRRERRGWEIGGKSPHTGDALDPPSPRQKTLATARSGIRGPSHKPYIPPITILQQRRRSQSLSSPRPAPSPPVDGQISPLLPAPDFGDPLSLSVVIPSPSYSHLDYSPAGSSISSGSTSQRTSKSWGKRASVVFPVSASMMRGDTRKGLGGYDAGKLKAREDAAKRLIGDKEGGRFASLKRSVSLRKKSEEDPRRARPRSQSLGSRSIKSDLHSTEQLPPPPLPVHLQERHSPSTRLGGDSAFMGGLSIDLGSRYINVNVNADAFSPRENTPSTSFASPRSADTSIFPASTPTSDCHSAIIENVIRIVGKPLHPAFNESDISILAPSTVGLGFSPVGTPESLPESLKAEVIDLTETGRKLSSPMSDTGGRRSQEGTPIVTPPTLQNDGNLPKPTHLHVRDDPSSGSNTGRIPRRSLLLAQNRFYLPPTHPKPVTGLQKKPSLRTSKSMGPGLIRRAYNATEDQSPPVLDPTTSGQSRSSEAREGVPPSATTSSFGRGLLKSASIRSTSRRLSRVFEGDDRSGAYRGDSHGAERMGTTPSMRFGRRPMTTFSICSPSDAIDPLPHTSPDSAVYPRHERDRSKSTHSSQGRPHSTLRSNKSSPFLSASYSLRVIFGKEGFVARSLSQAFERDPQHASEKDRPSPGDESGASPRSASGPGTVGKESLKSRISSPLEAGTTERRPTRQSSRSKAHEDARDRGRSADKAWRESVLQEAVSLSISSGLNKLGESPVIHDDSSHQHSRHQEQPRMVSSGSKNRLAIPDALLAAPATIRESTIDPDWSDLGATMMKPSRGSIESGLSLRAVVQDWAVPQTQRFLGQVGKEESSGMVSVPSVYSNGASTYVEKPSRRLQGKGFPTSFSISDLKSRTLSKTSRRSPSPSPLGDICSNSKGQGFTRGVRERGISPPIPLTNPVSVEGEGEGSVEVLRESRYIPGPGTSIYVDAPSHPVEEAEEAVVVKGRGEAGLRCSSSRSGLFNLSLRSRSPNLVAKANANQTNQDKRSPSPVGVAHVNGVDNGNKAKPLSSGFGLSLRTRASIRSQRAKSPIDPAHAEGLTHKLGVYRTPSGGIGNSLKTVNVRQSAPSSGAQTGQLLLDALIARDGTTLAAQAQMQSNVDVDAELEADGRRTEEREREKVRQVLEWRDEVGENEDIARLEERMRGFVVGEKERIKVIGRGSGSSEGLRV
ncbi:hypothetical protein IAU59_006795 [Kwoniella sp. CBS 9459]